MDLNQFLIGIYDEDVLRADLLHNKLEQLRYGVAFSCSTLKDLFDNLETSPALLFFGINSTTETVTKTIRKIRKLHAKPKILLRISGTEKLKPLPAYDKCTTIANSTFRQICEELSALLPDHPMHRKEDDAPKDMLGNSLSENHPYYQIIADPEKYTILKLSAEGKSSKEIAVLSGMDFYHVEALRKQILRLTKSNNITEAVANAKEMRLI